MKFLEMKDQFKRNLSIVGENNKKALSKILARAFEKIDQITEHKLDKSYPPGIRDLYYKSHLIMITAKLILKIYLKRNEVDRIWLEMIFNPMLAKQIYFLYPEIYLSQNKNQIINNIKKKLIFRFPPSDICSSLMVSINTANTFIKNLEIGKITFGGVRKIVCDMDEKHGVFKLMQNVPMSELKASNVTFLNKPIGTTDLATCFALIIIGHDKDGKKLGAIYHDAGFDGEKYEPRKTYDNLVKLMGQKGCTTLDACYVVGGSIGTYVDIIEMICALPVITEVFVLVNDEVFDSRVVIGRNGEVAHARQTGKKKEADEDLSTKMKISSNPSILLPELKRVAGSQAASKPEVDAQLGASASQKK